MQYSSMKRRKGELYVEFLPKIASHGSSFQLHLMDLQEDITRRLQRLGVTVVDTYSGDAPIDVLIVMISTGRIGDELPHAIRDLDKYLLENATFFAAIQDDEYTKVGKEALPANFKPEHLLDLVVVPGKSQLKDCPNNDQMLRKIAKHMGVKPGGISRILPISCGCVFMFLLLVLLVLTLLLVLSLLK